MPCDVREQADVDRAIASAADRFGAVDVLVNNAGIIQVGPMAHMTLADYEDAMRTHFWGPLFAVRAALPHMRRQGGGRIVNISSIGGRLAVPHMLPYSASKFALAGLSDGLRAELAHQKIAVTTVIPGLMRTGSPVNALFKGRHADRVPPRRCRTGHHTAREAGSPWQGGPAGTDGWRNGADEQPVAHTHRGCRRRVAPGTRCQFRVGAVAADDADVRGGPAEQRVVAQPLFRFSPAMPRGR
jgi:NAD(P)-dependent dehydrogenase (short-subunit alcohol dehydrogenase family)